MYKHFICDNLTCRYTALHCILLKREAKSLNNVNISNQFLRIINFLNRASLIPRRFRFASPWLASQEVSVIGRKTFSKPGFDSRWTDFVGSVFRDLFFCGCLKAEKWKEHFTIIDPRKVTTQGRFGANLLKTTH